MVTLAPSGPRSQSFEGGTNDPNDDLLELVTCNRRTVPDESLASPWFNHS